MSEPMHVPGLKVAIVGHGHGALERHGLGVLSPGDGGWWRGGR